MNAYPGVVSSEVQGRHQIHCGLPTHRLAVAATAPGMDSLGGVLLSRGGSMRDGARQDGSRKRAGRSTPRSRTVGGGRAVPGACARGRCQRAGGREVRGGRAVLGVDPVPRAGAGAAPMRAPRPRAGRRGGGGETLRVRGGRPRVLWDAGLDGGSRRLLWDASLGAKWRGGRCDYYGMCTLGV